MFEAGVRSFERAHLVVFYLNLMYAHQDQNEGILRFLEEQLEARRQARVAQERRQVRQALTCCAITTCFMFMFVIILTLTAEGGLSRWKAMWEEGK